MDKIAKTAV